MIGNITGLGDAGQVADHHSRRTRRNSPRVLGTLLVARVQNHLMSLRQQPLAGHEAEASRRSGDEKPAHSCQRGLSLIVVDRAFGVTIGPT